MRCTAYTWKDYTTLMWVASNNRIPTYVAAVPADSRSLCDTPGADKKNFIGSWCIKLHSDYPRDGAGLGAVSCGPGWRSGQDPRAAEEAVQGCDARGQSRRVRYQMEKV